MSVHLFIYLVKSDFKEERYDGLKKGGVPPAKIEFKIFKANSCVFLSFFFQFEFTRELHESISLSKRISLISHTQSLDTHKLGSKRF